MLIKIYYKQEDPVRISFKALLLATSITLSIISIPSNAVPQGVESVSARKSVFADMLQQSLEMNSSIERLISKSKSEDFPVLTREIPRLKLMIAEVKALLDKAKINPAFNKLQSLNELFETNRDLTDQCNRLSVKLNDAEYDTVKREIPRLKLMNDTAIELIGKLQAAVRNVPAETSALSGEDAERILPLLTRLISQLNQTRFLATLKHEFLIQMERELTSVSQKVTGSNKRLKRQIEAALQQIKDVLKENNVK